MDIRIRMSEFYSEKDEQHFFETLKQIRSIRSFRGVGRDLILSIDVKSLSVVVFQELIALLRRYRVPLRPLSALADTKTLAWIKDPQYFWYKHIFDNH
jgi:hypothetical protein